jgi:hypothetical protein
LENGGVESWDSPPTPSIFLTPRLRLLTH